MPSAVLTALQKASDGLLYPSDADEPFTAFAWTKAAGDVTADKTRPLAGVDAKAPVEERTAAEFFQNLTADGADDADKFKALQKVVGAQLSGVKVFRFGGVEKEIYVVGQAAGGGWAGLKTKAVET